jgi:hypothetical protein
MLKVVSVLIAFTLASNHAAAEGESVETEQDSTVVDLDAAEIEKAKQEELARKKQQIPGYQPITVAGQEIDATYLEETSGDQHGVIVFFNDKTQLLESSPIIRTLRQSLPQYGWSTISFAMDYSFEDNILLSPSLENIDETIAETPTEETAPKEVVMEEEADQSTAEPEPEALPPVSNTERIEAIISFIKSKDYARTIFFGLGDGGEIAANIMAPLNSDINALVLLEAGPFSSYEQFEKIFKPIVDIHAEYGKPEVKQAIKQRKKIMKVNEGMHYSVRSVSATNTTFLGAEERLTRMIRGWLYKQFLAEKD